MLCEFGGLDSKPLKFMIISFKKWCVYTHHIRRTCIWVGSGCARRPYDSYGQRRNQRWFNLIKNNNFEVDIKIVKWFSERRDAILFEACLIKQLSPICNKLHNGWRRPRNKNQLLQFRLRFRKTLKMRSNYKTELWKKRIRLSWKNRPLCSVETRRKNRDAANNRNRIKGRFA